MMLDRITRMAAGVAVLTGAWAVLLAISPAASGATPMHGLSNATESRWAVVGFLALVTVAALAAHGRRYPNLARVALVMPQQFVLLVAAWTSIAAIVDSHYADGVTRPWEFIAADQATIILLWLFHAAALIRYVAQGDES